MEGRTWILEVGKEGKRVCQAVESSSWIAIFGPSMTALEVRSRRRGYLCDLAEGKGRRTYLV